MTTSTRQTVREELLDRYGLGRRGTATAGAVGSITDTGNLKGPSAAEGLDVGCQVMVTLNANDAGAAPENEITQLASRPKQSTGVFDVEPDFTAAVEVSDTFEILYKPLRFDGGQHAVHEAINKALADLPWARQVVPFSLVPDGDMLASGTTDWTETGDGAITKVAASFPHALRVLRMTGVTADDYIVSGTIAVEENESYYVEVTGMISGSGAAADQGTLILYDKTNDDPITLDETTIDRFEPELLINTVTMPSGCEQVEFRLEADNAGDIIDWADLILRKNNSRELTVADRPVRIVRLGNLLVSRRDEWGQRGPMTVEPAEVVQVGNGIWQYQTKQSLAGYSVWYEEFVTPGSLDSDTDTTSVPKEDLAPVAAEILLRPLRGRSAEWAARYEVAAKDAAVARMNYRDIATVRQGQRTYRLGWA